jgi:hypothetical protein
MIQELILTLTPQEKETLQQRVDASTASLHKFIGAVLKDPELTKEQLQKLFKINENTYFKNLSLAKDEIYDVIKVNMKNSYDDLLLPNILYRRGLDVQASKLRLKLEAQYDKQGWWSILNELYSLDMMVAYTKCDIGRMEQIRDKTLDNAARLSKFIKVDREVIVQMAIIEKGDLKEKDFDSYESNVKTLLKQARDTDHHIPIFNALHSLYVLYTKNKIDIRKAKDTLTEIHQLIEKYDDRMIPYTVNTAWLNTMGFHVEFATAEGPLPYFKKVEDAIGMHGLLYDAEALLGFCVYYFWTGDKANFTKRFEQFAKIPTDKSLQYKQKYLQCLRAYLFNAPKVFNQCLNEFYTDEISREYNDHDLTLRYIDILMLIKDKNFSLASDKLEAAIKFIRRNFTSHRVAIEKPHWEMLKTAIAGKSLKPRSEDAVLRINKFLHDELSK